MSRDLRPPSRPRFLDEHKDRRWEAKWDAMQADIEDHAAASAAVLAPAPAPAPGRPPRGLPLPPEGAEEEPQQGPTPEQLLCRLLASDAALDAAGRSAVRQSGRADPGQQRHRRRGASAPAPALVQRDLGGGGWLTARPGAASSSSGGGGPMAGAPTGQSRRGATAASGGGSLWAGGPIGRSRWAAAASSGGPLAGVDFLSLASAPKQPPAAGDGWACPQNSLTRAPPPPGSSAESSRSREEPDGASSGEEVEKEGRSKEGTENAEDSGTPSRASPAAACGEAAEEQPGLSASESPQSGRSAASACSARTGASSRSRRSGMTQAEVDEMVNMAFERNRLALREALSRLQTRWVEVTCGMPRQEVARFRAGLCRAGDLRESLQAVRDVSDSAAGMELALLWERCRVRGLLAVAIRTEDALDLRELLVLASSLGMSVDFEQDLLDELEEREGTRTPTRAPSISSSSSTGAPTEHSSAAHKPLQRAQGWWHWWPWWRQRGSGQGEWKGNGNLLRVTQDHIQRGNKPVPHELAIDLGLRASLPDLTPSTVAKDESPPTRATVRSSV